MGMTLDVYSHTLPSIQRKAVVAMERITQG